MIDKPLSEDGNPLSCLYWSHGDCYAPLGIVQKCGTDVKRRYGASEAYKEGKIPK